MAVSPPKLYAWKLRPRPYSNTKAPVAYKQVIDAKTADWHYNKHQKGYVDALNKIEKGLRNLGTKKGNGNYSEYGELKRRLPWNHSGALLHDVYWNSFGYEESKPTRNPKSNLMQQITEDFGSFTQWKKDFINTALSAKLSGWAVLVFDSMYSGKLMNVLVDEHQNGAIWGGIPVIALDMFEHSYYHRNGPNREAYIANFMDSINWPRVEGYYNRVVMPVQRAKLASYFNSIR